MWTGVQAVSSIGAGQSELYFTWGWPAELHVLWSLMPTTPAIGSPSLEWDVSTERANQSQCTYWITVKNLTTKPLDFELRFAVLS